MWCHGKLLVKFQRSSVLCFYMKAIFCFLLHSTSSPRAGDAKEEHTETTCRMIKGRQFCFTRIAFTVVVTPACRWQCFLMQDSSALNAADSRYSGLGIHDTSERYTWRHGKLAHIITSEWLLLPFPQLLFVPSQTAGLSPHQLFCCFSPYSYHRLAPFSVLRRKLNATFEVSSISEFRRWVPFSKAELHFMF